MTRLLQSLLLTLVLTPLLAQGSQLDALLKQVQRQIQGDQAIDQRRLEQFQQDHREQARQLAEAEARLEAAQARQSALKARFQDNEAAISEANQRLKSRTGQLGEVFGVIKQQGQEARGLLADSLVNAQYPRRLAALAFADSKRIPTLEQMEGFWLLLFQEMTATSEQARFEAPVVQPDGSRASDEVLRVGPFVAIDSQGRYLTQQEGRLQVLAVQPAARVNQEARAYIAGRGETLTLDPSRGNLLALLAQTPNLMERIHQGGLVGYIILALGAIGLLVGLVRLLATLLVEVKVARQRRHQRASPDNPLGRLLLAGEQSDRVQERELRIDEALLKEQPGLERGLTVLKLIATVAPLLGLLGTVTGMIATFQSITLFGTGDPKLMAGGISQALVTTVLGLTVAIPLLLGHSLLATRSRRLLQRLQQQGLALLAEVPVGNPEEALRRVA